MTVAFDWIFQAGKNEVELLSLCRVCGSLGRYWGRAGPATFGQVQVRGQQWWQLRLCWLTGSKLGRGGSSNIWPSAGQDHGYGGNDDDNDELPGNYWCDHDDDDDTDDDCNDDAFEFRSSPIYSFLWILFLSSPSYSQLLFRFYQLEECRQEVPLLPGLKDELEKRVALKKSSQWFIQ